ncbi:alpha/beta hydrolase [Terrilactibacillus laevilacticus]|uniref:alpha/beta hydrolase n=1 Tax=Terrilactibacillus laevilacticus TaxID=1380157 RepID=UPI0011467317|nr:alpha/beta fold hydrolase [Terrilactibacillus laevilacticus]
MNRFMKAALVTAGATIAAGYFVTNKIMYIRKKTDQFLIDREVHTFQHFDLKEYQSMPKEPFSLRSPYGYLINGHFIPGKSTQKIMIFCHGVTVNQFNSVKYANLFLKRGYSVIIYDHRRHGQSGGKTTSYGYYEKYDLETLVNWVKERFGNDIILGIHGESMGASTMLQYAGMIEDGADFYIADCPFSDFYQQLHHVLNKDYHLPKWPLLPMATLFIRIRDHYRIQDVSPMRYIKNVHHPVLFIHSKQDDYILNEMTVALYAAKPDNKQLFLAELGSHACSYSDNKKEYEAAIDNFLASYHFN